MKYYSLSQMCEFLVDKYKKEDAQLLIGKLIYPMFPVTGMSHSLDGIQIDEETAKISFTQKQLEEIGTIDEW